MIKNQTKNTVVSKNLFKKSAFEKIKGLIGEKTPQAIILKTRFGIHTFLVKFPIDVAILDKNKRVVALKNGLKPNRFFFWNIKYDTVIELPEGSLQKSKMQLGDVLEFNL